MKNVFLPLSAALNVEAEPTSCPGLGVCPKPSRVCGSCLLSEENIAKLEKLEQFSKARKAAKPSKESHEQRFFRIIALVGIASSDEGGWDDVDDTLLVASRSRGARAAAGGGVRGRVRF